MFKLEDLFANFPPPPPPPIEIVEALDLGGNISLVRKKLADNSTLFNNPEIQGILFRYLHSAIEGLLNHLYRKRILYKHEIESKKLSKVQKEEYHTTLSFIKLLTTSYRICRCWIVYFRDKKELGLLGNIDMTPPKEIAENPDIEEIKLKDIVEESEELKLLISGEITVQDLYEKYKYENHIFTILFIEILHEIDLSIRRQIHTQVTSEIDNVIIPKINSIANRSIDSLSMSESIRNISILKFSKNTSSDLVKFGENYLEEHKKEMEWRLVKGLAQMHISEVGNYLQYHGGKYDGKDDEYFEFVENAISQYLQKIPYQHQNKAFQWLQKMKNPDTRITLTKEASTPLNIPDIPKIPDNKLVFTIDVKHLVYLMLNLKKQFAGERKLLEASDGAIMAFIIRHFCDKDYNSFSVEDLTPYFEKGTKLLDEVLKWNGENVGFGNIWMKFNQLPVKETSYITSSPEKIVQILAKNFHSKKDKFFTLRTLRQNIKPSVHHSNKESNNFDIEELMNLN